MPSPCSRRGPSLPQGEPIAVPYTGGGADCEQPVGAAAPAANRPGDQARPGRASEDTQGAQRRKSWVLCGPCAPCGKNRGWCPGLHVIRPAAWAPDAIRFRVKTGLGLPGWRKLPGPARREGRFVVCPRRISKDEAHKLIDELPADATREDLMREIYVRQAIEKGLDDSEAGRTRSVSEVRENYGLSE